jgi:hypothetical protein
MRGTARGSGLDSAPSRVSPQRQRGLRVVPTVMHRREAMAQFVAAALLAGGTFTVTVEQRQRGAAFGRRRASDARPRWRGEKICLRPGQVLVVDPSHLPAGTELGLVRPQRRKLPPLEVWLTYRETGLMLIRTPKTLRNLVSKHRLEHRTFWDGRGRYRRRLTMLPPATARRLAELTGKAFLIRP